MTQRLALPFAVWTVTWRMFAPRSATGLRGGGLTPFAVMGLLGAEILSKLLLLTLS